MFFANAVSKTTQIGVVLIAMERADSVKNVWHGKFCKQNTPFSGLADFLGTRLSVFGEPSGHSASLSELTQSLNGEGLG